MAPVSADDPKFPSPAQVSFLKGGPFPPTDTGRQHPSLEVLQIQIRTLPLRSSSRLPTQTSRAHCPFPSVTGRQRTSLNEQSKLGTGEWHVP